jgi:ABC-type lipoprotein export system ATPase subunit
MITPPVLVRVRRVTQTFPRPEAGGSLAVLRDLSLEMHAGASVAIMGPSGSGKTTLLHLLGALSVPESGEIWLGDQRLDTLSDRGRTALRRRELGFIFQDHALLPHLTALENVLLPTLGDETLAMGAGDRARRLLGEAGMGERLHHRPSQLSMGQCQRVAVCRARINRPRLLLADEPTGALDRSRADALVAELLASQMRDDCGLIVVTHDERVAGRFRRVLDLVDGRLVERGVGETP